MPVSIDPDESLAILNALYWALLALTLGLAIVGLFYWADVLRGEHQARRKRHFGGV
jgi:hypothetical protein